MFGILDFIRIICLVALFASLAVALDAGVKGVQWLGKWDDQTNAIQQDAVAAYATAHFAFAVLCVLVSVLALWGYRAASAGRETGLSGHD
jgi:hypothetical protein